MFLTSLVNIINILRLYSCVQKLQSQIVSREKLCKTLLHKKGAHKKLLNQGMLLKRIEIVGT